MKISAIALSLLVLGGAVTTGAAAPLTAEIAKSCREQAIKAHPTAVAGSRSTAAEDQRQAFRECVAQAQSGTQPPAGSSDSKPAK